MKIAVILPAYNEELTIRETIVDFYTHIPHAQIYVVDNNSTDDTGKIARNTFEELNCNGKILFEQRQGKGNAIRYAFDTIDADIFIMADADTTYAGGDANILMEPVVENRADMVVGDRHRSGAYRQENDRLFHNMGNILVRKLINFLFGSNLNDILSGYRVFNKKFVKNFPILCEGFELETEITLHALDKNFVIQEIPITYQNRPEGSFSKLSTIQDGLRVIKVIFDIFKDYRPFAFFGSIALMLFILGLNAGVPVILEYARTKYISHVPLSILASGLMVSSLLSLAIGIILNSIARMHRFNFELHLKENNARNAQ